MTVRKKIALLITAAGFLSSLVFSCIILWESLEQPFRIIDSELATFSHRAAAIISKANPPGNHIISDMPLYMGDDKYWLKVYASNDGRLIYQSHLGSLLEIAEPPQNTNTSVSIRIPKDIINLTKGHKEKVTFRIRKSTLSIDGKQFVVCAGRPMEKLEEEIWDIILGVISGLGFSVMVLMAISYFVAGVILKPVREINDQTRDITEKHLERRIPVKGHPDEFNELARTLNHVFERLQHAFIRQKQLLADASHELKTPLTMMRLALEATHSPDGTTTPRLQGDPLIQMTDQVLRMEKLVKNLLDLSSIEIKNTLKNERIDAGELITSLIEDYQLWIEHSHIKIISHLSGQLLTYGDFEKLNRAFSNLIDNAIKYNISGGRIQMTGSSSENRITLMIENTGPGVAADKIDKIFDPFFRVEQSRSLQHGGSGLGLAIVKRIIELHHGTITFESMPGIWSRVTVLLPGIRNNSPKKTIGNDHLNSG